MTSQLWHILTHSLIHTSKSAWTILLCHIHSHTHSHTHTLHTQHNSFHTTHKLHTDKRTYPYLLINNQIKVTQPLRTNLTPHSLTHLLTHPPTPHHSLPPSSLTPSLTHTSSVLATTPPPHLPPRLTPHLTPPPKKKVESLLAFQSQNHEETVASVFRQLKRVTAVRFF
jgi:hypothetical protein